MSNSPGVDYSGLPQKPDPDAIWKAAEAQAAHKQSRPARAPLLDRVSALNERAGDIAEPLVRATGDFLNEPLLGSWNPDVIETRLIEAAKAKFAPKNAATRLLFDLAEVNPKALAAAQSPKSLAMLGAMFALPEAGVPKLVQTLIGSGFTGSNALAAARQFYRSVKDYQKYLETKKPEDLDKVVDSVSSGALDSIFAALGAMSGVKRPARTSTSVETPAQPPQLEPPTIDIKAEPSPSSREALPPSGPSALMPTPANRVSEPPAVSPQEPPARPTEIATAPQIQAKSEPEPPSASPNPEPATAPAVALPDRQGNALSEDRLRAEIKNGGGRYRGLQEDMNGALTVTVHDDGTGTTLQFKPSEVTAENVRQRIAQKRAEFGKKPPEFREVSSVLRPEPTTAPLATQHDVLEKNLREAEANLAKFTEKNKESNPDYQVAKREVDNARRALVWSTPVKSLNAPIGSRVIDIQAEPIATLRTPEPTLEAKPAAPASALAVGDTPASPPSPTRPRFGPGTNSTTVQVGPYQAVYNENAFGIERELVVRDPQGNEIAKFDPQQPHAKEAQIRRAAEKAIRAHEAKSAAPAEAPKVEAEAVPARTPMSVTEAAEKDRARRRGSLKVIGSPTEVHTVAGVYPAHYALVDADEVLPSHNPFNFQENEFYPKRVQPRDYFVEKEAQLKVQRHAQEGDKYAQLVVNTNPDMVNGPPGVTQDLDVLGGNSRDMSLKRMYRYGTEKDYIDRLKENAHQFGLTPEDVAKFKHPELVRVLASVPDDHVGLASLARDLNGSFTASMSPNERAIAAGRIISLETLDEVSGLMDELGEDANIRNLLTKRPHQVIKLLSQDGVINEQERSEFIDKGTGGISEEGKVFIRKAILGAVLDDKNLLDNAPVSMVNKIETSIAPLVKLKARADWWDVTPLVRQALREAAQIDASGKTVEQYLDVAHGRGLEVAKGEREILLPGMSSEMYPAPDPVVEAVLLGIRNKKTADLKAIFKSIERDSKFDVKAQGLLGGLRQQAYPYDAFNDAFKTNFTAEQYADAIAKIADQEAEK